MPEIDFVSNDRLIAFGDTQVILFEGTQKPGRSLVHKVEKEVKSIFYDKRLIMGLYIVMENPMKATQWKSMI